MKISQIKELLDCTVLTDINNPDIDVTTCMCSDMMSDVLAFAKPGALLLTGLTNSQSVRTADIADSVLVIYVRGKKPDQPTIELANSLSIPLFSTVMPMFEACGILHREGVEGIC